MSVEYLTHVWKKEKDVKGTNLLGLLAIADSANGDDGSCYGGLTSIADKMRLDPSGARATLRRLQRAHKILILKGKGIKTKSGPTNRYVVVAPGINCESYEDLCKKWDTMPIPYKPLKKDKRGGNNPIGINEGGLNSTGHGGLNSTGHGGLNSTGNPLEEPSYNQKDSITAAEADGDPEPSPIPETPQPEEPPEITPVQESPDEPPQDESAPQRVISSVIRTPLQKNGKPKTERQLIYEIVCLGSFGKYYENMSKEADGHANAIVKELIDGSNNLTHIEVEGAYRLYADEQRDKKQTITDKTRIKVAYKILSRVDTYRDQQAQIDRRTDDDIRATFTPLQKLYADEFPDESPQIVEATSADIMRLRLRDKNIVLEGIV